jgi:hypothetical protein
MITQDTAVRECGPRAGATGDGTLVEVPAVAAAEAGFTCRVAPAQERPRTWTVMQPGEG